MTLGKLANLLEKLLKIHQSLYEISFEKTDIIKYERIEELDNLIKVEHKHIAAMSLIEKERIQLVSELARKYSISTNDVVEFICKNNPRDEKILMNPYNNLLDIITKLKKQNALNQALINQSLQYINVNLSMLQPHKQETNYLPPSKKRNVINISLFDSKA